MNEGRRNEPAGRRRWHVPPPLTHGPESLEGARVLEEFPTSVGLLLWQALRDVMLWSAASPPDRGELFGADAAQRRAAALANTEVPADTAEPLTALAQLVEHAEAAHGERIGLACRELAQWAEREGALGTALAFAQAAALASPGDAAAAFRVGQIARRRAEHARAESWFRRTVGLARQSQDWASYALALSGLGTLYAQRGNFPAARRFHVRALRAAKRHTMHSIAGGAEHDLFVLALESGKDREAAERARSAFAEYGPVHPRIPHLAHDVAYFWSSRGHFARALPVFQALLPHLDQFGNRFIVWSNIARAAGGAGRAELFDQAWAEVWGDSERDDSLGDADEDFAEGLLELARGASLLGQWDRAEEAALRSLQIAQQRGEARIQLAAESVVDAIRHDRQAGAQQSAPAELEGDADVLAELLIDSLTTSAPAAR